MSPSALSVAQSESLKNIDACIADKRAELEALEKRRREILGTRVDSMNVDGLVLPDGIRLLGEASKWADGTWTCLANVHGALCRIEVKVTEDGEPK